MHELALVRDVVDVVLDTAKSNRATRVSAVNLTVGAGRDIVDSLFRGCFEYFTRGTIAHGADLRLTRVPFAVRCRACECVYHINMLDAKTRSCPSCGGEAYELVSGMEFRIDGIEIA